MEPGSIGLEIAKEIADVLMKHEKREGFKDSDVVAALISFLASFIIQSENQKETLRIVQKLLETTTIRIMMQMPLSDPDGGR